MLQAGEAQFIYPVPPEMIKSLKNSPTITVFDEPSILIRYVALNNMRKPFDDPRVRLALNYAIDKQAFAKVVFSGLADPMDSPMPQLLGFLSEAGQLPVRSGEGEGTAGRGGLSERVRDHADRRCRYAGAARHAVHSAAACRGRRDAEGGTAGGRRADGEDLQCAEARGCDHRHAVRRAGRRPTGDADWGMRPMLYTKSFPPVLSNMAWYSNPMTDAAIEEGLATVDPSETRDGVRQGAGAGVEGCAVDLSRASITIWRLIRRSCTGRSCGRISSST